MAAQRPGERYSRGGRAGSCAQCLRTLPSRHLHERDGKRCASGRRHCSGTDSDQAVEGHKAELF